MPIVPCDQCGESIDRPLYPSKNSKHYFCNHKCRGKWQSEHSGIIVNCHTCGRPTKQSPSRIAKSQYHFCSRQCMGKWQSTSRRGENSPGFKGGPNRKCAYCSKPVRRGPAHTKNTEIHFCSRKCKGMWHSENLSGENSPSWKGGRAVYYGPGWICQKRTARKRDGYQCQLCGISEKKYKKALDVHHIIPFREFNYISGENENHKQANKLSNLICLCSRCHIQVEHNYVSFQLPIPIASEI